jgi:hypothetical protein
LVGTPGEQDAASLRGSFKGRLRLGDETMRLEGGVAAAPPDRLRVDLWGPMGGVRAILASHGGRVVVVLPATRQYMDEEEGTATYEALIGVPLDTHGLIRFIASARPGGCAPREEAGVTLSCVDGYPRAVFDGGVLDLRLTDFRRAAPGEFAADLFDPAIPEGFSRLRPDPPTGRPTRVHLLIP